MKTALLHYWLTNMRGGEKVLAAIGDVLPQADIFTHAFGMGMREKGEGRRDEGRGRREKARGTRYEGEGRRDEGRLISTMRRLQNLPKQFALPNLQGFATISFI